MFDTELSGDRYSVLTEGWGQQGFKITGLLNVFGFDITWATYWTLSNVILHHRAKVIVGFQVKSSHETPQFDSVLLRHQIQDILT